MQEVVSGLASLQQRRYIVERYLAGLQRLTIVAYPEDSTNDPIFITFQAVEYVQMPTFWQDAPFMLATPDECRTLLEQVGIEIVRDPPHLFMPSFRHRGYTWFAGVPRFRIRCHHVEVR
jgi:hypothetical protein